MILDTTTRTRFKFGVFAFCVICAIAILKHFLPGISETLILTGTAPVITYILADTFRPGLPPPPKV